MLPVCTETKRQRENAHEKVLSSTIEMVNVVSI